MVAQVGEKINSPDLTFFESSYGVPNGVLAGSDEEALGHKAGTKKSREHFYQQAAEYAIN